jgi:hypothetical protein
MASGQRSGSTIPGHSLPDPDHPGEASIEDAICSILGRIMPLMPQKRFCRQKTTVSLSVEGMGVARPYAVIIGAMKCGTTSLLRYLSGHPQIAPCRIEEPHFFSEDDMYSRGLDWYESLFQYDARTHRICLENSNSYAKYPYFASSVERIAQDLDNPRFIYIVRDPVDRVVSHFNYSMRHGWINAGEKPTDERFLSPSRYAMQLERFERFFPKESIFVVRLEDMMRDPQPALARVQAFLGLDVRPLEHVDERHNVARASTQYHYLQWRLGLKPYVPLLKPYMPPLLRKVVRQMGSGAAKKITLSPGERVLVAERLEQDALALLERYGIDPRGKAWPLRERELAT